MKIRSMEAQLFRTDRTDRTKLKVAFCNFENAPKKILSCDRRHLS